MSAYLVNEDTLDLLASIVSWQADRWDLYIEEGILPPRGDLPYDGPGWQNYTRKHASEIKRELLLENIASIEARYPQDRGSSSRDIAPFSPIYLDGQQASYLDVLGAARCYRYQSCESDTWEKSYAHAIIEGIISYCIQELSAGKWEYDRPADSPRVISLMDLLNE